MGHGWMEFLFGTPQRGIRTIIALVLLACVINPRIGEVIMMRIMNALTPFLIYGIVIFIFLTILGVRFGGGRRH